MLNYMAALSCVAYCGNFLGLMFGCLTNNAEAALGTANLFVMMSGFGAGLFANTGSGANWFVTFLSWISPLRYGCEIIMRQVTKGRQAQDAILESFGYTYGDKLCYGYLCGFLAFCFFFGWFMLWIRNRDTSNSIAKSDKITDVVVDMVADD